MLRTAQTNVKGTFLSVKSFSPNANPSHAVVLAVTSGMAAMPPKGLEGLSAYLASKLAQTKIIEFLSAEQPNLFAATMHPGMVETAIFQKSGADAKTLPVDKGKSIFTSPCIDVLLSYFHAQFSFQHTSCFGYPTRKLPF